MRVLALIVALCLVPFTVLAVQPDEILSDPLLEGRARELSKNLRCPVCQNETIDDSNADISRELRLALRERLVAGDTDDQAMDFLVRRYGEYILLRPTTGGGNMLLWWAGPLMLAGALLVGAGYLRSRSKDQTPSDTNGLTDAERARLSKILDE